LRSLLAAAAVLAISACEDQSAVPGGNPGSSRLAGPHGAIWPEDAIVGANGAAWAQQAIDGYERAGPSAAPARIEPLDTSSCVMTKPAPDAIVRHVFVEQGAGAPPLFVLPQGASAGAEAARLRVVNVAVTETSAPVHLVLASERSVIWNIVAAPEARVSGVTALSGASLGVANAPADARIEALYGEALSRCEVVPARRPQKDWGLAREARAGGLALARFEARNAQADVYDAWVRKWFGAPSAEAPPIAPMSAGAVLVGPMPSSPAGRIPMKALQGATLKLSIDGRLIVGDERDYEAAASGNGAQRGV
jgi:hypothetical protein